MVCAQVRELVEGDTRGKRICMSVCRCERERLKRKTRQSSNVLTSKTPKTGTNKTGDPHLKRVLLSDVLSEKVHETQSSDTFWHGVTCEWNYSENTFFFLPSAGNLPPGSLWRSQTTFWEQLGEMGQRDQEMWGNTERMKRRGRGKK